MKRLLALPGGQPLRSNDWAFIQDAAAEAIAALIVGLKGTAGPCIVSGLEIEFPVGTSLVTVSAGVLFDGTKLCSCPSASFTWVGGEQTDGSGSSGHYLFFTPNTTTEQPRNFKDSTVHNVWQHNDYVIGYADAIPSGSLAFPVRLLDMLTEHILDNAPDPPEDTVLYCRKSFSSANLHQNQFILQAPGSGKAIQVVSFSARIVPISQMNVGDQTLKVFYDTDPDEANIGLFTNGFLETGTASMQYLSPSGEILDNKPVSLAFSGLTQPSAGSATIIVYCIYKIIAL
jgi:hypothetical protein